MMLLNHDTALIVQSPQQPAQLILLFHGIGSNAHSLLPVAERLCEAFPQAMIVSVNAPDPTPGSPGGFQWFALAAITEENRIERVAAAMPAFEATIAHWQANSGVKPHATALIGFSQGAIMALESTQVERFVAGRVVSMCGRFAQLPRRVPPQTTLHFLHGKEDSVIHYGYTVQAAETLVAWGADITADVIPFLGHGINEDALKLLIERLQLHVPKRVWDEAMRAADASVAADQAATRH